MNMTLLAPSFEEVPGILFPVNGKSLFTGLHSPVLILVKNEDIRQEVMDRFAGSLTSDETEKSRRFRFARDRNSYIIVHGLLRQMLGRHLGINPGSIEISYNAFGRPSIEGYSGRVFFNLSHSSGISALAFDPNKEIGVDVEYMKEDFNYNDIVRMFFSKQERQAVDQPDDESRSRFYEIWTRKEAFLKAMGIGITEHLNVEVISERVSNFTINRKTAGDKEFFFRSMVFEQKYRITLAMGSGSGPLRGFVFGKNGLELEMI